MLRHLLPSEPALPNPIFNLERARLGPTYARWALRRHAQTVFLVVSALATAASIVERALVGDVPLSQSVVITITALIGIVMSLLASVNAAVVSVRTVEDALNTKRLENLRTTHVAGENVIEAYTTLAETRAWRLTIVEIALRFALALLFFLDWFADLLGSGGLLPSDVIRSSVCGLAVLVAGAIFTAFILEAVLRLRALVVVNVALALRLRSTSMTILVSVVTVSAIHLLQLVALVIIWNTALGAGERPAQSLGAGLGGVLCVLPIGCMIALYGFYFFYQMLRTGATDVAVKTYLQHGE